MSLIHDLFVRIKGDKTHLEGTLKGAGKDVKKFSKDSKGSAKEAEVGFKGMTGAVGGVVAAALVAAKVMIDWAKGTEWGTALVNKGLAITKQLLQDIMTSQTGKGNLKEAARISESKSEREANRTKDDYEAAKMQSELNQLTIHAADHTKSLAEKKEILSKAMQKEAELKNYLLKQARAELKDAHDYWKINLGNIDAKNEYYRIAKKIVELEGSDSLRLTSQYTNVLQQQKERADALVDAFTPLVKTLEDLKKEYKEITKIGELSPLFQNNKPTSVFEKKTFGLSKSLSNKLAGAPTAGDPAKAAQMAEDWQGVMDGIEVGLDDSQQALVSLSETFAGFFSDVNMGFQAMIDGVITGIKRLVMELIAKAAFLAILSAIFPGSAVPLTLGNILGGNASKLVGSGSSSGVTGLSTPANMGYKEQLMASVSGKDLQIVLRRS